MADRHWLWIGILFSYVFLLIYMFSLKKRQKHRISSHMSGLIKDLRENMRKIEESKVTLVEPLQAKINDMLTELKNVCDMVEKQYCLGKKHESK